MPTSHPRHSVTETPELAAALDPLRQRLGTQAPSLSELIMRGAATTLRELEARERASAQARATFVERLREGPRPDLEEARSIRHATREP